MFTANAKADLAATTCLPEIKIYAYWRDQLPRHRKSMAAGEMVVTPAAKPPAEATMAIRRVSGPIDTFPLSVASQGHPVLSMPSHDPTHAHGGRGVYRLSLSSPCSSFIISNGGPQPNRRKTSLATSAAKSRARDANSTLEN